MKTLSDKVRYGLKDGQDEVSEGDIVTINGKRYCEATFDYGVYGNEEIADDYIRQLANVQSKTNARNKACVKLQSVNGHLPERKGASVSTGMRDLLKAIKAKGLSASEARELLGI